MGGFALALGGAGQAAQQYTAQTRQLLEQRKSAIADMLSRQADAEPNQQKSNALRQTGVDVLTKDTGGWLSSIANLAKKHNADNQKLQTGLQTLSQLPGAQQPQQSKPQPGVTSVGATAGTGTNALAGTAAQPATSPAASPANGGQILAPPIPPPVSAPPTTAPPPVSPPPPVVAAPAPLQTPPDIDPVANVNQLPFPPPVLDAQALGPVPVPGAMTAALPAPDTPAALTPPPGSPAANNGVPDIYSVREKRKEILDRYAQEMANTSRYFQPNVQARMKEELDALAPLEMIAEKQGQFEQFKQTPEYAAMSDIGKSYAAMQAYGLQPYAPPTSTYRPQETFVRAEDMSPDDKVANGIPANATGPYTTYTNITTNLPARKAQPGRVSYEQVAGLNGVYNAPRIPGPVSTENGAPALPVSTLNTRPIGRTSMADVLQRQASGETFQRLDGKPLNPEALPRDTAFAEIRRGNQIFYEPITPGQKAITVGNVVYPVTEFTMADVGTPGGPQPLGPKTVGTASTPISITVGPNGEPIVTGSTRTPASTGAFQRPGATTAPPPPAATTPPPVSGAPVTSAIPPPVHGAAPATTTIPPVKGAPKTLPALPPAAALPPGIHLPSGTVTVGQDTVFRKAARPVRALMAQVFGDANNPDIPSMESFAHLADDPAARQRIGTAIRLLQTDESNLGIVNNTDMSGWTAHGGSGPLLPVSVGGGLNGEKMIGSRTLDPKKAAELNAQIGSAMAALKTPEERQAVVASLKAYEEASGLRALISSGGALASIATIQKTLPIIGTNTFSAQDYKDRLKRLAEDGANGAWGIPANYFGQDVVNRLNEARTGKTSKTGAVPPVSSSVKTGAVPPVTVPYRFNGTEFDIPDTEVSGFLKTHPGAVVIKQ